MSEPYIPVIGLEVHIELSTKSKMFCSCSADHFGKEPNTQTCPVCLGLPGALPVPNKKALEWCITLGLALQCSIPKESKFDRKNYFYPDLPKGYQISQYDMPLCRNGNLEFRMYNSELGKKEIKNIRINRVHLEEDTGKLQHVTIEEKRMTLVDFNRSGVPLVEIVTEPDFHAVEEVDQFVKKLQRIIRYLGISNADMEKGSMRIEPSISLRKSQITMTKLASRRSGSQINSKSQNLNTEELPNYRVELKNINSFRFVRKAIEYEINRQTEMLDRGEQPAQQTRGYSESKNITVPQREKEEAHDYRYFPEPDIPPMRWDKSQITNLKSQIGEMPDEKSDRLKQMYGLSDSDIEILIESKERADYFERCVALSKSEKDFSAITSKQIANYLINRHIDYTKTLPRDLLIILSRQMQSNDIDIPTLTKTIESVISTNRKAVEDYTNGKATVLMFLVGQVKRELKGKGNAEQIEKLIKEIIV